MKWSLLLITFSCTRIDLHNHYMACLPLFTSTCISSIKTWLGQTFITETRAYVPCSTQGWYLRNRLMSLYNDRTHWRSHTIDPKVTGSWPPWGGGAGSSDSTHCGRTWSVAVNLAGHFGWNQFPFLRTCYPWSRLKMRTNYTLQNSNLNIKEKIFLLHVS